MNVRLTLACWDYDRTRALRDGRVTVEGVDLTYLSLPVEETFFRMLRYHEFDAAEMSLSSYVLTLFADERPFVAIPVFPSRAFRHSAIYVRSDSGLTEPEQLAGHAVGVPEYQMTAAVWIRGILAEHHQLPVNAVHYRTGGLQGLDRQEKLALSLPEDVHLTPVGAGQTLTNMLLDGEISALYSARAPAPFAAADPRIRRLFTDAATAERHYFDATGIFPIMHAVVLRRDVYEKHPWLAQNLTTAFTAARDLAYAELAETTAIRLMLPYLPGDLDAIHAQMGTDFWPYGQRPNAATLQTFMRYSVEQHLAARALPVADLFAAETAESFVI
jgi:4,5-dihydroxyphthalate decarboxylase